MDVRVRFVFEFSGFDTALVRTRDSVPLAKHLTYGLRSG